MSFFIIRQVCVRTRFDFGRSTTGKTWPELVGYLTFKFKIELDGYEPPFNTDKHVDKSSDKSIIVIGMRGTGKSTLSEWLASFWGSRC